MSKKKITGFIIALLVIAAAVTGIFMITADRNNEKYEGRLYFLNETATTIESETRTIAYKDRQSLIEKVINELMKGPEEGKHQRIMDKKTKLLSVGDADKRDIVVNFSKEFTTGDKKKDILAVYAVVRSLCDIADINRVKVMVENSEITGDDGTVIGYLTAQDINLAEDTYNSEIRSVSLYFPDRETGALKKEVRSIKANDQQPMAQHIINELINGPKINYSNPSLSKDTVLLGVETSNNICFINFKSSFVDKNSGSPEKEKIAIFSIVDSLTEVDNIKRVQFLMDGKRVEKFGNINIFGMFGRDEGMIQK